MVELGRLVATGRLRRRRGSAPSRGRRRAGGVVPNAPPAVVGIASSASMSSASAVREA